MQTCLPWPAGGGGLLRGVLQCLLKTIGAVGSVIAGVKLGPGAAPTVNVTNVDQFECPFVQARRSVGLASIFCVLRQYFPTCMWCSDGVVGPGARSAS